MVKASTPGYAAPGRAGAERKKHSDVVEAGCKTVIGKRLKQSGMEWSVRGANAIIALRCMMKSDRFEDYWEDRVA